MLRSPHALLLALAASTLLCSTSCLGSRTCISLEGDPFVSLSEASCGDEMCSWTIEFDDGFYHWHHDTVIEHGEYECAGESIEATGCYDMRGCTGRYDGDSNVLLWEGMEYARL